MGSQSLIVTTPAARGTQEWMHEVCQGGSAKFAQRMPIQNKIIPSLIRSLGDLAEETHQMPSPARTVCSLSLQASFSYFSEKKPGYGSLEPLPGVELGGPYAVESAWKAITATSQGKPAPLLEVTLDAHLNSGSRLQIRNSHNVRTRADRRFTPKWQFGSVRIG